MLIETLRGMRLDNGDGAEQASALDLCFEAYARLPWIGLPDAQRNAIRSAGNFCASFHSIARLRPEWMRLMEAAFPPKKQSLGDEGAIFESLLSASEALGLSRLDEGADGMRQAFRWAPALIGGASFCHGEADRRGARLALCQMVCDSSASRVFFDPRSLQTPSIQALEIFLRSLLLMGSIRWPSQFEQWAFWDPEAICSRPNMHAHAIEAACQLAAASERSILEEAASESSSGRGRGRL